MNLRFQEVQQLASVLGAEFAPLRDRVHQLRKMASFDDELDSEIVNALDELSQHLGTARVQEDVVRFNSYDALIIKMSSERLYGRVLRELESPIAQLRERWAQALTAAAEVVDKDTSLLKLLTEAGSEGFPLCRLNVELDTETLIRTAASNWIEFGCSEDSGEFRWQTLQETFTGSSLREGIDATRNDNKTPDRWGVRIRLTRKGEIHVAWSHTGDGKHQQSDLVEKQHDDKKQLSLDEEQHEDNEPPLNDKQQKILVAMLKLHCTKKSDLQPAAKIARVLSKTATAEFIKKDITALKKTGYAQAGPRGYCTTSKAINRAKKCETLLEQRRSLLETRPPSSPRRGGGPVSHRCCTHPVPTTAMASTSIHVHAAGLVRHTRTTTHFAGRHMVSAQNTNPSSLIDAPRLTFTEVARRLNVNSSTIWRWVRKGVRGRKLPSLSVGGRRFILESDLEAFLDEGRQPRTDLPTSASGKERLETTTESLIEKMLDQELGPVRRHSDN